MKAQYYGHTHAFENSKYLERRSTHHLKRFFIVMSGILLTNVGLPNTIFAATQNENLQQQVDRLQQEIKSLNKKINTKVSKTQYSSKTRYVLGGNNYIYTDSRGPKKFEQLSSSDIPLSLLKMKNMYPKQSLALGGLFEFEPINSWFGDDLSQITNTKNYHHGTATSISNVSFDAMMNVNDYTQMFTQFSYTGNPGTISLMSGFVTFGNLKKSPFFASIGKFRPRFGVFPGGPYYATIPQGIFRPGHLINTTVGYSNNHLDTYVTFLPTIVKNNIGNSIGRKNGVMVSAFYSGDVNKDISYGVNAGYVSDVASTSSSVGTAIASTMTKYQKIPALNVDANVTIGPINVSGGYQTTTKKAYGLTDKASIQKAKASSYYAQVAYSMKMYDRPITFALNYSKAKNTENVAMPLAGDIDNGPTATGIEKQLGGYAIVHINKSLAVGLEYARMKTYTGKHSDEATLYTAVYF